MQTDWKENEHGIKVASLEGKEAIVDGLMFSENIRWREDRFWFDDLMASTVYSIKEDGSDKRVEFKFEEGDALAGQHLSGLGWTPDNKLCIVVMSERLLIQRETADLENSKFTYKIVADLKEFSDFKTNDMVIDSKGRAYIGEFGFDIENSKVPLPAKLIMVDTQGDCKPTLAQDDLTFPNGVHLSKDEKTMYLAESFVCKISAFDVDQETGKLSNKRTFGDFSKDEMAKLVPGHETEVYPDGIAKIDVDGGIWFSTTKSAAMRVNSEGKITHIINLNDEFNNFCVGIGGVDGKTMLMSCFKMDGANMCGKIFSFKVESQVDA